MGRPPRETEGDVEVCRRRPGRRGMAKVQPATACQPVRATGIPERIGCSSSAEASWRGVLVPLVRLDPAGLAGAGVERDQRAAAGAGLRPHLALAAPDRRGAARGDDVDRAVHAHEAGIVEDQRIAPCPARGAGRGRPAARRARCSGSAAAGRRGRPRGTLKPVASTPTEVRQRIRPSRKAADDAVARPLRRLAREGLAGDGPRPGSRRAPPSAWATPAQKASQARRPLPVADHLLHRRAGDPVLVDGGLQGARDVVAAAPRDARRRRGSWRWPWR